MIKGCMFGDKKINPVFAAGGNIQGAGKGLAAAIGNGGSNRWNFVCKVSKIILYFHS